MVARIEAAQLDGGLFAPRGKALRGLPVEGLELGMAQDGSLQLGQRQRQLHIARVAADSKNPLRTPGSTCQ